MENHENGDLNIPLTVPGQGERVGTSTSASTSTRAATLFNQFKISTLSV